MNDSISVIVPIYNTQDYLSQCIDSIVNQTYRNLEIILVDDGSTDNSGAICEQYARQDSRIKVVHKTNGGISSARNLGLSISNGNFVQFVDSDDFMEPNMIEVLYNNAQKYCADVSMCSHFTYIDGKSSTDATNNLYNYTKLDALKELLLDKTIRSYAWNKLFSKKLFEGVKFPEGRIFEDIITIPKLFEKAQNIVLEDVPLYYYRQRNGSILHVQTNELRLNYISAVLEVQDYIRKNIKEIELFCDYNLVHATVKTFYDIGLFKMFDLMEEKEVQELYAKTKQIFNDSKKEAFILNQVHNIWKVHLYYLIQEPQNYVLYNKYLPILYPEYIPMVNNSR